MYVVSYKPGWLRCVNPQIPRHCTMYISVPGELFGLTMSKARVDHSKAFVCTTCGWGFFVLGLFTFKG